MLEHEATLRLTEMFARLPKEITDSARRALRDAVHDFVDASKTKGAPIERVVIALKEVAAQVGIRSSTEMVKLRSRLTTRDQVLLDVVRWAVERYFGYERPQSSGSGAGTRGRKRPPTGGQEMAPRFIPLAQ